MPTKKIEQDYIFIRGQENLFNSFVSENPTIAASEVHNLLRVLVKRNHKEADISQWWIGMVPTTTTVTTAKTAAGAEQSPNIEMWMKTLNDVGVTLHPDLKKQIGEYDPKTHVARIGQYKTEPSAAQLTVGQIKVRDGTESHGN